MNIESVGPSGYGDLNSQSPKTAKHYVWVCGGLVVLRDKLMGFF